MYDSTTVTEFRPIQGVKIWKEDHHQCTSFSPRAWTMREPYEIRHKRTYKITYDNRGKIVLKRARYLLAGFLYQMLHITEGLFLNMLVSHMKKLEKALIS